MIKGLDEPYGLFFAFMTSVLAMIPLFKLLNNWIYSNRHFKNSNLELLYESMLETENLTKKLIVEQVFYSIFRVKASFEIIELLLSQDSPTQSIEYYREGRKYLNMVKGRFVLKEAYQDHRRKKLEPKYNLFKNVIYYILTSSSSSVAFIATFNLFEYNQLLEVSYLTFNFVWMGLLLLIAVILACKAILIMTKTVDINSAIALIESQPICCNKVKWYY